MWMADLTHASLQFSIWVKKHITTTNKVKIMLDEQNQQINTSIMTGDNLPKYKEVL